MGLSCKDCRFFNNEPAWLEKQLKGMRVFSSGYASVKSEDGLCARKDIYLSAQPAASCREFEQKATKPEAVARP